MPLYTKFVEFVKFIEFPELKYSISSTFSLKLFHRVTQSTTELRGGDFSFFGPAWFQGVTGEREV